MDVYWKGPDVADKVALGQPDAPAGAAATDGAASPAAESPKPIEPVPAVSVSPDA